MKRILFKNNITKNFDFASEQTRKASTLRTRAQLYETWIQGTLICCLFLI